MMNSYTYRKVISIYDNPATNCKITYNCSTVKYEEFCELPIKLKLYIITSYINEALSVALRMSGESELECVLVQELIEHQWGFYEYIQDMYKKYWDCYIRSLCAYLSQKLENWTDRPTVIDNMRWVLIKLSEWDYWSFKPNHPLLLLLLDSIDIQDLACIFEVRCEEEELSVEKIFRLMKRNGMNMKIDAMFNYWFENGSDCYHTLTRV